MTTTGPTRAEPTGHLSGTEPPPPVAVPRAPFVVMVLLLVAGGVLGILLLNTKINENAFVIYELRQEQDELEQREQQLEQEIAEASAPNQLAARARGMGLVDLGDELVHLRLSESAGGELTASEQPTGQVEGD